MSHRYTVCVMMLTHEWRVSLFVRKALGLAFGMACSNPVDCCFFIAAQASEFIYFESEFGFKKILSVKHLESYYREQYEDNTRVSRCCSVRLDQNVVWLITPAQIFVISPSKPETRFVLAILAPPDLKPVTCPLPSAGPFADCIL